MINPYLWVFVMSAIASVPVRAEVRMRFDGKLHFELLFKILGLRLKIHVKGKGQPNHIGPQWRRVVEKSHEILLLLKSFHFRVAELHAHISCGDAALAAVGYAFIRCLLCTVQACLPFALKADVEMDFRAEGSFAALVCITDTRVGKLGAAILRLWLLTRAQSKTEEEKYAASY